MTQSQVWWIQSVIKLSYFLIKKIKRLWQRSAINFFFYDIKGDSKVSTNGSFQKVLNKVQHFWTISTILHCNSPKVQCLFLKSAPNITDVPLWCGRLCMCGGRGYTATLWTSCSIVCKPKTSLKNQVYFLKVTLNTWGAGIISLKSNYKHKQSSLNSIFWFEFLLIHLMLLSMKALKN